MLKYDVIKSFKQGCAAATLILLTQTQTHASKIDIGFDRHSAPYIRLTGSMTSGDGAQFNHTINAWRERGTPIKVLFLNSDGGDVQESYSILKAVIENKISTVVLPDEECLSACVAVFAAGRERVLTPTSSVGVHRAITDDGDTPYAKAASVEMMEVYKYLNIPDSIRLKMIDTPPSMMYYLTLKEKEMFSSLTANFSEAEKVLSQSKVPKFIKRGFNNDRKRARSLNDEGIAYIQAKKYSYAVYVLEQAKDINPADAEILGNLGYAYYMTKKYENAETTLTASLEIMPTRGASWNNLGLVLSAKGDVSWATDCFVNYWKFSKNKEAATNQFFVWEEEQPGTTLDLASKNARAKLGLID